MKRIAWFGRTEELSAEVVDGALRERGIDLPRGLPSAGWKKGGARNVQLSSEKFPGSTPVWIWEER